MGPTAGTGALKILQLCEVGSRVRISPRFSWALFLCPAKGLQWSRLLPCWGLPGLLKITQPRPLRATAGSSHHSCCSWGCITEQEALEFLPHWISSQDSEEATKKQRDELRQDFLVRIQHLSARNATGSLLNPSTLCVGSAQCGKARLPPGT